MFMFFLRTKFFLASLLLGASVLFAVSASSGSADMAELIVSSKVEAHFHGCDADTHDQCDIYGATIYNCEPSSIWHTCPDGN